MPRFEIEIKTIDHITTDAIGPKGQRVFYLQAIGEGQVITLIAEKFQIQSLAVGVEQFLVEVSSRFPELPEASPAYVEEHMLIQPPVDPLFRIADIGLGYSADEDKVILIIHELLPEDSDQEPAIVRLWCSRHQLRALAHWSLEIASRGRPTCPQCGQPMEDEGHFCVKKNGGHRQN